MSTLVSIIMGSKSDWPVMEHASLTLDGFNITHEVRAISAHRAANALAEYIKKAEQNGAEVIIAAAGGAAHLPGVIASKTTLPVLGVPMESTLNGLDSLLSIVQMPKGIPVGTLSIGKAGAINSALLAVAILANKYPKYKKALQEYRQQQTEKVLADAEIKN